MLQFERGLLPGARVRHLHALKFKDNACYALEVCPYQENWLTIFLHYNSEIDGREPCIGKDCRCGGTGRGWSREERVYVPVHYLRPMLSGSSAMLPSNAVVCTGIWGVTTNSLHVLTEHGGKGSWLVRRQGTKRNGPIVATNLLWMLPTTSWESPYPMVESLSRLFGVQG